MNQLEKAIIDGAVIAQKSYTNMTNWWLSHGPEYFITCAVANNIAGKNGFSVFPEGSPKKIVNEREEMQIKLDNQRFDLVIWQKASYDVRAIIEIKMAYNIEPLQRDRNKINKYMVNNDFVKNGYLLAYTEAKCVDTLSNRFSSWSERLECQLVGLKIGKDNAGTSRWAVGLLKLKNIKIIE